MNERTLFETLESIGWTSIAIWVGLVIFAITFLVVMVTRWGQAKPLSKCIGLSVFAHILLMAFAYGTQLLTNEPIKREEPKTFRLVSVDQSAELNDEALQNSEQKPWEELLSDATPQPEAISLTPQEMLATDSPAPTLITATPRLGENPTPEVALETPEIQQPIVEPTSPDPLAPHEPVAAAIPIEPKELPRKETPSDSPIGPMLVEGPARMTAVESAPVQSPSELPTLESPTDIIRPTETATIADAAIDEELGDILAGPTDNMNPMVVPGDTGAMRPPTRSATPTIEQALKSSPRRLGDGKTLPEPYRLRGIETRLAAAQEFGGSKETEQAVEAALKWLARNQRLDGRWSAAAHGGGREERVLGHDRNSAGAKADTGVTGLALLAFLGAGHTHLEGDYRDNVRRALEYLAGAQKIDGNLAGDASFFAHTYCHGMATLAFSEAYAMTGDPRLKAYAERAIGYSLSLQDETTGGWRYRRGEKGDMSQFGWQVMALRSAELAGIEVPTEAKEGMHRFLLSCSSGEHGGLGSYRERERPSIPMTAEALTCRYFLRQKMTGHQKKEAAAFINRQRPGIGKANYYYWYYGTLALYMQQGPEWEAWNSALQADLLSSQLSSGSNAGSWNPDSEWGGYGGRVFTTSMAALCLEVYYRYLPVYRQ